MCLNQHRNSFKGNAGDGFSGEYTYYGLSPAPGYPLFRPQKSCVDAVMNKTWHSMTCVCLGSPETLSVDYKLTSKNLKQSTFTKTIMYRVIYTSYNFLLGPKYIYIDKTLCTQKRHLTSVVFCLFRFLFPSHVWCVCVIFLGFLVCFFVFFFFFFHFFFSSSYLFSKPRKPAKKLTVYVETVKEHRILC